MRTITTSVTVYTFAELNEQAQEKAVDAVRANLNGDWWDQNDNDDIQAVMVWILAQQLGTPGHEKWGEADYPGIPDITVDGWDLDRGQSFVITGSLTRTNAPTLPWVAGLDEIEIEGRRHNNYYVCVSETLTADEVDAIGAPVIQALRDAVHTAWKAGSDEAEYKGSEERARESLRDAVHTAWKAGSDEAEYKGSEERAREWIDGNAPEFTENGDLYS